MSLKLSIVVFLGLAISPLTQASELRLKDGRTYARFLSRTLDIPWNQYITEFDKVKANLPKSGDPSEFIATNDSLAKLAHYGCDEVAWLDDGSYNLDWLYQSFLKRKPTIEEREKAILKKDGSFDVFANCMVIALHPQVILSRGAK